jgi:spermidine/putrescine transport system ATP-binding protein
VRNICLKNVSKTKNGNVIFDNISLEIPSGEFFALLGPSGCGKTTLLRLIAGLEKVDSGKIFLGNVDITEVPVHKRKINVVFQNYALFPHLTVFDNVAYSLLIEGRPKDEIEYKVHKLLKAFHLEEHVYKKPSMLSGGQQQRVAIARAIIIEPEVLLLDEPLAALDFKLREKLLIELIDLQDKLSTTFVYVTHDQFEALTVADHMAIMSPRGKIGQIGTPKEIYEFPNSTFVAQFVGNTNIFDGNLIIDESETKFEVTDLGSFSIARPQNPRFMSNREAIMSIRPEKIFISKKPVENFSNTLKGTVSSIVYTGRSTLYEVMLKNRTKVQVFEQNEEHFPQETIDYDDEVYLSWQKENVILLEA